MEVRADCQHFTQGAAASELRQTCFLSNLGSARQKDRVLRVAATKKAQATIEEEGSSEPETHETYKVLGVMRRERERETRNLFQVTHRQMEAEG